MHFHVVTYATLVKGQQNQWGNKQTVKPHGDRSICVILFAQSDVVAELLKTRNNLSYLFVIRCIVSKENLSLSADFPIMIASVIFHEISLMCLPISHLSIYPTHFAF